MIRRTVRPLFLCWTALATSTLLFPSSNAEEVKLTVLGPSAGQVRLADNGPSPVVAWQVNTSDVSLLRQGQITPRLPFPAASLQDIREDGAQILATAQKPRYRDRWEWPLDQAYLVDVATGSGSAFPAYPTHTGYTTGLCWPTRYSRNGQIIGKVSLKLTKIVYSTNTFHHGFRFDPATSAYTDLFPIPADPEFSAYPESISDDGSRIAFRNDPILYGIAAVQVWTGTSTPTRELKAPALLDGHSVMAISGNGRWLSQNGSPDNFSFPSSTAVYLWDLEQSPPIAKKLAIPPDQGTEDVVASVSAVLNDGTVFGWVGYSTHTGYQRLEASLWHPSGHRETLAAAVQRQFGQTFADWSPTTITDVSADGRWLVGKSLTPAGATQAWLLELPAAWTPVPAQPDLWVADWQRRSDDTFQLGFHRTPLGSSQSQTLTLYNFGSADLLITAASFEGPAASQYKVVNALAQPIPFTPLTIPPHGTATLRIALTAATSSVQNATLRLTSNDADRPEYTVAIEGSGPGPDLTLNIPGTSGSKPLLAKQTPVGRTVSFRCNIWNNAEIYDTGTITAQNLRIEFRGANTAGWTVRNPPAASLPINSYTTADIDFTPTAAGTSQVEIALVSDAPGVPAKVYTIEVPVVEPAELIFLAPDGTPLTPEQRVLDFGAVSVGAQASLGISLKNTGTGPQDLRLKARPIGFAAASFDTKSRFVFPRPVYPESVATIPPNSTRTPVFWFTPKEAGDLIADMELDDPENLAAPVLLRVRGTGSALAVPQFAAYPSSRIRPVYPPGTEPSSVKFLEFRTLGAGPLTARLKYGSTIVSTITVDTVGSFPVPQPRAVPYVIELENSAGSIVGPEIHIGRVHTLTSSVHQFIGKTANLGASTTGPGWAYHWSRAGQFLEDGGRISGTHTATLSIAGCTLADAALYRCTVTLLAPDVQPQVETDGVYLTIANPPVVEPFSLRDTRVLEGYFFTVKASQDPLRFAISGLPPGMKYDPPSGIVYGQITNAAAPKTARVYQVTVRAVNRLGTGPAYVVPWRVEPYADAALAGTYHGVVSRSPPHEHGGKVAVTMTSTGTCTIVVSEAGRPVRRGRSIVISRSPDNLPAAYDPPLPEGMGGPAPMTAAVLLGDLEKQIPDVVCTFVDGILAGQIGNDYNAPLITGIRQTPATEKILIDRKATRHSLALQVEPPTTVKWLCLQPASSDDHTVATYTLTPKPGAILNPGLRSGASTWVDSHDRLHLLGGRTRLTTNNYLTVDATDHWVFDTRTGLWSWLRDREGINAKKKPSASPAIGAFVPTWNTSSGDAWIFADGTLWHWSAATETFAQIHPSNSQLPLGNYGALGVPSADNRPRIRHRAVTWVDDNDQLWMFGGHVSSGNPYIPASLGDLWKFDTVTRLWTWMGGSPKSSTEGFDWHSDGVFEPARSGDTQGWTDLEGNLWLYGWAFAHSTANTRPAMWKYNIAQGQWTLQHLMTGYNIVKGTHDVPAPSNTPGTRFGAITWTDASGKLWLFEGSADDPSVAYIVPRDRGLWYYDIAQSAWAHVGDSTILPYAGFQRWITSTGAMYLYGSNAFYCVEIPRVPLATGFLTLLVQPTGACTWAGRLGDGAAVTGSSVTGPVPADLLAIPGLPPGVGAWLLPLHQPLYTGKGSFQGFLTLFENTGDIGGLLDWNKRVPYAAPRDRSFPDGFPLISVAAEGNRYDPKTALTALATGAPNTASQGAFLLSGALPGNDLRILYNLDIRQRLTFSSGSPTLSAVRLTFTPATGLFTGTAVQKDPAPAGASAAAAVSRTLTLNGLLLPAQSTALGIFTLPDPIDPTYVPVPTAATTPIRSGPWYLSPAAP